MSEILVGSKIIKKIDHDRDIYRETVIVNWCLGNTCNYICSYCPEFLHNASKPWLEIDVVKAFCQKTINHYKIKNNRRLFIEFTGGEVTLYKNFFELVQFLREQDVLVSIISNGSRRLEFWQKVRPLLNHICLSFHPESADVEHFKAVVIYLSETLSVHVNLMMHPEHFEKCRVLGNWVANNTKHVTLAVQPLIIDFKDKLYPYSAEQLEFIKKPFVTPHVKRPPVKYRGQLKKVYADDSFAITTAQQLISNGENNWRGWRCWIGVKQIVVDMDGNVYRGWCLEGGKIGNVSAAEKIVFPEMPVICTKKFCHCVLDVMNEREPSDKLLDKQIKIQHKKDNPGWLPFF